VLVSLLPISIVGLRLRDFDASFLVLEKVHALLEKNQNFRPNENVLGRDIKAGKL